MRKNNNKREHKNWLVCVNASRCDHYKSLKEAGFISWIRERNNFAIGDIVYIFSSKEGKIIYKAEVDINDLFSAVAEIEENNLKKKNIILSYSCKMEKRLLDKDLMISLLTNLVDNAIKASDNGSDIYMEAKENIITVRDSGCGIPEDEISRVTEAFYMISMYCKSYNYC